MAPEDPRNTVNWDEVARSGLTVVVLMGVQNLPAIARRLIDAGLSAEMPAAVIEDAALPTMRVVRATASTLGEEAPRAGVEPPDVAVLGEVAGLGLDLTP